MTKYIIEYCGGTKGDLLCRFLNNDNSQFLPDRANKTEPADIGCLNWLKLADPYQLTLERFEEVLSTNTKKYLPAHPLWVTYDDDYNLLLKKYDYEIMQLRFEECQYITIRIESNLKNANAIDHPDPNYIVQLLNTVFWKGLDYNTFTTKELNSIPRATNNEYAWQQRAHIHDLFLSNDKNRKFIFYSDLYLNFNCGILNEYDIEEWKFLVRSSWCEYKENGYMDWDKPYPSTNPTSKYSDVIEKWIKENG